MRRILSPLLLLALLVAPAAALDKEPTGLGKAQLGMSPTQIEKLYKGQVSTLNTENMGATPVRSPFIIRQALAEQKVPGLPAPVKVELRYWKDKLWVIIVYYGTNSPETVDAALRKDLGPPSTSGQDAVWLGKKVQVNTANRERWYAIADLPLSKEAQKLFMEEMGKMQDKMRQQQGGGAPPATPAGK